jgi:hypothetical protein
MAEFQMGWKRYFTSATIHVIGSRTIDTFLPSLKDLER